MIAIRMVLVLTILCGLIYPLAMTGIAQVFFPREAGGSLIVRDGRVRGSELIGQGTEDPRYFWSRPSATAGFAYNAASSSGSNLGPKNPARQEGMDARLNALLTADPVNTDPIPIDLLTASGSGLDPHISLEAAEYQVKRVARLRGLELEQVQELVRRHTEQRQFGTFGEQRVNILLLNEDLDRR